MSVLTIRIPQGKHERLKNLAKSRGVSVNKLMEELSAVALAQHDAEVRFRAMARRGSAKEGLALLDKLDRASFKRRAQRTINGGLRAPNSRAGGTGRRTPASTP
jgi:hypothetical protein